MRIISLFSGAGGLDLGLERAGHSVIWANDCDPDAVATYRRNFGERIDPRPIQEIPDSAFPVADAVVGGFPCQGFSLANRLRTPEDERNHLFVQFARVLGLVKPAYFIAENVRGILSLGGGKVAAEVLTTFRRCGYRVVVSPLNAADFGVPQARVRVIFLGTRNDLPASATLAFPRPTHARADQLVDGRRPWATIGEALEDLPEPDAPHDLFNHVCSNYKVTNRNFTGHRWTDPNKPSPTILARGNGGGGVCAIQHPRNHRRLSVRESAVVQTFPMGFVFEGRLNSMYRQVGNAVPPRLAEHLGRALSEAAAQLERSKCA